ncbi:MAG: copper amine oxidase-like protein [Bacillales bacterium]|jgi:hypothetical protein|nr:copper amine oxidase-like protein [Bacillales bacterium]
MKKMIVNYVSGDLMRILRSVLIGMLLGTIIAGVALYVNHVSLLDLIRDFNDKRTSSKKTQNIDFLKDTLTIEKPILVDDGSAKIKKEVETGYEAVWKAYQKGEPRTLNSRDQQVYSKALTIIGQVIKPNMTDYQKEKALHDYIVLNTKYDYENLLNNSIPDHSYRAYGVLINGVAVCQGYAEAIYLLLNMVGIECQMVYGTADNGSGKGPINHAWNAVKIDGNYYMLDSTWDDPAPDKAGRVQYDYFNVTSSQLAKDHTWEEASAPVCTATAANYYVVNRLVKIDGMVVSLDQVISTEVEFKNKVLAAIQNRKAELMLFTQNGLDLKAIDRKFIFDTELVNEYSYGFSTSGILLKFKYQ